MRAVRFACLPWYDLAELRGATDALWAEVAARLRARGLAPPVRLDRQVHYEDQWDSGELLLGQACGYDVLLAFAHRLQVVATPRYALPGCDGPSYRSFVVVRDELPARELADLRGARCVINTPTSHSGMNVLRALVAPLAEGGRFFSDVVVSGAHERSLDLLRRGAADVAAIDCVTYGLLARHRPPALHGTRVVHRTPAVPAPPFVTSVATPAPVVAELRAALAGALAGSPAVRAGLALDGVDHLPLAAYQPIAELAAAAEAHQFELLTRSA